MGNRGVLHDGEGRIEWTWALKRWIVCVPELRGRKRRVTTPGRYTELFFLDEPTALAAGHRPCAECRHARLLEFCNAWRTARPDGGRSAPPTAQEIDDRLHAERVAPDRSKRTFEAAPDGVFVAVPAWGEEAFRSASPERSKSCRWCVVRKWFPPGRRPKSAGTARGWRPRRRRTSASGLRFTHRRESP